MVQLLFVAAAFAYTMAIFDALATDCISFSRDVRSALEIEFYF